MGILSQALSWHQGDLALGLGAGIGGGMRSTTSSTSSTSAVANSVVPRAPVHPPLPLQHAAPALSATTSTCFYANHPTPRVLPAEPDDNIFSAAQELQYTYGYREIKKKINAFASCMRSFAFSFQSFSIFCDDVGRDQAKDGQKFAKPMPTAVICPREQPAKKSEQRTRQRRTGFATLRFFCHRGHLRDA